MGRARPGPGDTAVTSPTQPVRWGILGAARIARQKVVPGMLRSDRLRIVAVASRDADRAAAFAAECGAARAHASYEALIADPDVEAIYNPLPNHLHVPLTLAAARAGKHVLCEKPVAITAAEAEALRQVPAGVLVAEAFMIRHHPQWKRAAQLVAEGAVGELRSVQVLFSYFNDDPANIRNRADIGGGGLLDIGCYAVMSGRLLFRADPLRAAALVERSAAFGTDVLTSGLLDFGRGRHLGFTVSTQLVPFQRVQALGTKGRIEIEIPFNAPPDQPCRIFLDDGSKPGGRSAREIEFPAVDQYQLQAEAFGEAVRGVAPLSAGIEDAILNMRIIDAIARGGASGRWEDV
ncbi:Gfo/Idh/MocA family protein [Alsobacter sp. R-9]